MLDLVHSQLYLNLLLYVASLYSLYHSLSLYSPYRLYLYVLLMYMELKE